MVITFLQRLFWMLILIAAQVLVFNHIHLFGYATPLPFVYLILLFPLNVERWSILLWGFVCGLLCDISSLTLGIGAASMTLVAFLQPVVLQLMAPKDALEDMRPTFRSLGFWLYFRYTLLLTLIFVVTYFVIQTFNFFHPLEFLISLASSWVFTFCLCLLFESFRYKVSSK